MKKIILTLATVLTLLSCSKKEDAAPTPLPTGIITYTMLGQTFTTTDFIITATSNYKFKWVSDRNFTTMIGDRTPIAYTAGASDNAQNATLTPNGVTYKCSKIMKVTINSYDGKTVTGSFAGNVYLNGVTTNPAEPVTGSFSCEAGAGI